MTYKLHYFPFRGRGEQCRLLLHHLGVSFEDVLLKKADFGQLRAEGPGKLLFGSLPMLEDGDLLLPQGPAIMQYLGVKHGCAPSDPAGHALALAVTLGAEDFRSKYFGLFGDNAEDKQRDFLDGAYKTRWLPSFTHLLDKGDGFMIGGALSYADFAVWDVFDAMVTYIEPASFRRLRRRQSLLRQDRRPRQSQGTPRIASGVDRAVRIFQLTYFELTNGQHTGRLRLTDMDVPTADRIRRSALWSRAEEDRNELGSVLAMRKNRDLLFTLAGLPYDSVLSWTIREVGSAGAMDLVSSIQRAGGGSGLLLVDCMGMQASPARLREQMAQSVRIGLSTLAKVSVAERPAFIKLAVVAGWRKDVPVPTEAKPLPALQRSTSVMESVPEPQVWGYVPFVVDEKLDEIFVALGRWDEFNEEPWPTISSEVVELPWENWEPTPIEGWGKGALIELQQYHERVRVSLRLRASQHKASMKEDRHGSQVARRVRQLRWACYSGHANFGASRFVGETIEDGVPRLHWDWAEGQASSPEGCRTEVTKALRELTA